MKVQEVDGEKVFILTKREAEIAVSCVGAMTTQDTNVALSQRGCDEVEGGRRLGNPKNDEAFMLYDQLDGALIS